MDNRYITDIILNEIDEIRKLVMRFQTNQNIPPIFVELALAKLKNIAVELLLLNKDSSELGQLQPSEVYSTIQRKMVDARSELNNATLSNSAKTPYQKEFTPNPVTRNKKIELGEPFNIPTAVRSGSSFKVRTKQTKTLPKNGRKNIKQSIELNDKIWFIKELFSGSIDLYNQTLDYLNKLEQADQAMEYLQMYFSWDLNDPTVKDFFVIIAEHFDA